MQTATGAVVGVQSGTAGEGVCLGGRKGGREGVKGERGESRPRPLPCEAGVLMVVARDTRPSVPRQPTAWPRGSRRGLTPAISPGDG